MRQSEFNGLSDFATAVASTTFARISKYATPLYAWLHSRRAPFLASLLILDQGVRSATVIADKELACLALTTSDFAALSAKSPSIAIRLLAAIARELSGRLRTANRTIHQLDT